MEEIPYRFEETLTPGLCDSEESGRYRLLSSLAAWCLSHFSMAESEALLGKEQDQRGSANARVAQQSRIRGYQGSSGVLGLPDLAGN